jgi:hypothetical protein
MFVAILFCKAFHWLAEARVDSMEQMEAVPALTYMRLTTLLAFLCILDLNCAITVTDKILDSMGQGKVQSFHESSTQLQSSMNV